MRQIFALPVDSFHQATEKSCFVRKGYEKKLDKHAISAAILLLNSVCVNTIVGLTATKNCY